MAWLRNVHHSEFEAAGLLTATYWTHSMRGPRQSICMGTRNLLLFNSCGVIQSWKAPSGIEEVEMDEA
jgi:hypothetical protein